MKKFEDSEFFGDGSNIVAVYPVDYKTELSEVNDEMYRVNEESRRRGINSEALIRKEHSKLKYQNN